jgi:hypothetical protein
MEGSYTPKRTDVILSVATLALALVTVGVIATTGSTDEFVAWAWARHHNILSWYVRPSSSCRSATSPTGEAYWASCLPYSRWLRACSGSPLQSR